MLGHNLDNIRLPDSHGEGYWMDTIFTWFPSLIMGAIFFPRIWSASLWLFLSGLQLLWNYLIIVNNQNSYFSENWKEIYDDPNAINVFQLQENVMHTILCIVLVLILVFFIRYALLSTQKIERANAVLGRYFSPEIKDEIEQSDGDLASQKPKDLDVAILFTDIVGFTKLSEKMDPKDVLALLSEYQSIMIEAIFENKGTVDKFIGDAVMANFGTPKSSGNDAQNAFDCALAMNKKLKEWNASRLEKELPQIEHRIGIHYGPCVVGNMGSEQRTEFAVIGDPVNVASRICDACKQFDTNFIISKDVADRIGVQDNWENIKNFEIRGRKEKLDLVKIYE